MNKCGRCGKETNSEFRELDSKNLLCGSCAESYSNTHVEVLKLKIDKMNKTISKITSGSIKAVQSDCEHDLVYSDYVMIVNGKTKEEYNCKKCGARVWKES